MLIGHSDLKRDFMRLVAGDRLAHGYVFSGEPEIGKFSFAEHLAYLLETGEFEVAERPLQDALMVRNPLAGSERVGIDAMRDLKNFLWQKPALSKKRIAIVDNADRLTVEAQNAILKIAEEPPSGAVLILIAHQPDNLLLSLASRLQKIHFGRLSDEEMNDFLKIKNVNLKIKTEAFGRPGRALRLASDPATAEMEKCALQFLKASGPARSKLIKEFIDEQKENPALLDIFFESLILSLRRDSVKNTAALRDALHRLFLIKSYNTNKRLQLEAI